jgi:hypothetical protein
MFALPKSSNRLVAKGSTLVNLKLLNQKKNGEEEEEEREEEDGEDDVA